MTSLVCFHLTVRAGGLGLSVQSGWWAHQNKKSLVVVYLTQEGIWLGGWRSAEATNLFVPDFSKCRGSGTNEEVNGEQVFTIHLLDDLLAVRRAICGLRPS